MDNFDLRKFLIENKLTRNSQQLDELNLKTAVAAGAMALGTAFGAQSQTTEPTTPTTTQTTQTTRKPMYGTADQRMAAAKKREANRTKIFDDFVKGAFYQDKCVEEVSEEEYASGCKTVDNGGVAYI